MHIALDYYRILSVPIKADLAQIKRAYEDRMQQQARREYSVWAIASRKKILEQAYTVLSDPETKAEYDKSFFAEIEPEPELLAISEGNQEPVMVSTKQSVSVNPYIEIEPELLPGALIILYELAEYEMILHLGTDYLNQHLEPEAHYPLSSSNSNTATLNKIDPKPDILLCLALSYLELSREQWQCKEWEQAAISGQMGLKLLQQESLFPTLQAEITADLDLLKPYRILDLLSHNLDDSVSRSKGVQLLKEMLLQREGIEGNKNDPSGLKLDQFLCFIQQIRTYLTLQEQKEIFLAEAKRGSAPGSCVAAYTLIAEGYSQKKPDSIVKAKQIFQELSRSQDTHWERAICALLLGQTAESQAIVRQNPESKTFQLISKRSQYSPDLIPGICFYAEQWLQTEVLSQFKSLNSSSFTLHDYFDDSEVQKYLEKIFPVQNGDRKKSQETVQNKPFYNSVSSPKAANSTHEQAKTKQRFPWWSKNKNANAKSSNLATNVQASTAKSTAIAGVGTNNHQSATVASGSYNYSANNLYSKTNNQQHDSSSRGSGGNPHRRKTQGNVIQDNLIESRPQTTNNKSIKLPNTEPFPIQNITKPQNTQTTSVSLQQQNQPKPSSPTSTNKPIKIRSSRSKKATSQKSYSKKWLLLLGVIFGVGALGFFLTKSLLNGDSGEPVVVESVTPEPPETEINSNNDSEPAVLDNNSEVEVAVEQPTSATLNTELAQKTIQKWLDSKQSALGKEHQIEALNSILTLPALTQWRNTASYYKQNNIYRQFDHTLKINSVEIDPNNSDLATVNATVTEAAQHYQQGKLNQAQSYNSNLVVRYELVRQNDNWSIKNSELLEN